jgi:predicted Zn finger-like uncharacterized protein
MKTELNDKKDSAQTVYVDPNNAATVTCPHCGIRYKVNAGKVTARGRNAKLRCKCRGSFSVFFEYREHPRRELDGKGYYRTIKQVHVRGQYRAVPASGGFADMLLRNISRGGIGFIVPTGHKLSVGNEVEVMFTLDDEDQTRIERNAMVRRLAEGNYVGCEFMDVGHFDKTTGFYVIT